MSTGRIDALGDGTKRSRDLGSAELWERSLARSRQRRRLSDLNRRHRRRRKTVSLAVSASVAGGPILPTAVAAADTGPGSAPGAPGATVAAVQSSAHVVLEVGSQGALVAALQRRLNEVLAFSHLAVDGIYGPVTRAAVVAYQRDHGFPADGKVDTGMWARMFDAPVLVFGASGSAAASTHAAPRPHAQFAAFHRSRAKHAARDGGAALFRHASPGAATHPSTPSPAAATRSGGSLVAGGPGTAATPPTSVNGSGGASAIEVVSPTAPATNQVSTYVLTNGVALPLPRQYLTGGYVDQGVDYSAPGGTPEFAMGDGVIIGEGISGFGPNAPILKITSGPLTGLEVYYGHAGTNLVRVGQHVKAGQQITEVGYGIVGISTGPHLEIGFYPTGHMGAGSKMLAVINALLKQHPTGRVWGSTTGTAHVARDMATASRTSSTKTSPVSTGAATSSSGGAAVGSDAPASAVPPAPAAPPPAATTPAPPAVTPTPPAPTAPSVSPPAPAAPSAPSPTPADATGAPASTSTATPVAPAPTTGTDQTTTTVTATPAPVASSDSSTTATTTTPAPGGTTATTPVQPAPTASPTPSTGATTTTGTTTTSGTATTAAAPTAAPPAAPASDSAPAGPSQPTAPVTPAPSPSPAPTTSG